VLGDTIKNKLTTTPLFDHHRRQIHSAQVCNIPNNRRPEVTIREANDPSHVLAQIATL
jgi:hypothetical protein